MTHLIRAALAVGLLGCSAAEQVTDTPPILEITTPQRGTFSDAGEVMVSGRVTDEGPVRVTLDGTDISVAADGTFNTTITVEAGISIIETHAIDAAGNDVRDVRAVLAGTLAPSDGTVDSPIGARLGPAGLDAVGDAIAGAAENINFTTAAQAMNPVYNNTGCLGARIDITSVTLSNIAAALVPKANALDTAVAIDDVVVRMDADYKAACIGGSTTITVRVTKARIRDDLGVTIAAGKLKTSLPSPTVALEGFSIDIGGVPGAVESLLRDKAREGVEKALVSVIKSKVPPIADTRLAGLIARPYTASVLGNMTTVGVSPTEVELSASGLFVAIDTSLVVEGGEGGTFVATPMPITSAPVQSAEGLGVLVADDAVNQLFAGLWAAGAFDQSLAIDAVGPAAALLDDDVRTLDVTMSLPPTVTTSGSGLELAIGDLIVTAKDEAGFEVQRFALSVRTALVAGPTSENTLTLTTTTPVVFAQVLAQSEVVDDPLEDAELEGIITGVWGLVGVLADDALAKLPMPAIAGLQLEAPTVVGKDGYVVLDVGLR
jgi:hypothetical protein